VPENRNSWLMFAKCKHFILQNPHCAHYKYEINTLLKDYSIHRTAMYEGNSQQFDALHNSQDIHNKLILEGLELQINGM
jgi:hypothetical protein